MRSDDNDVGDTSLGVDVVVTLVAVYLPMEISGCGLLLF